MPQQQSNKQELFQESVDSAIRRLLGTSDGKDFLLWLLSQTHVLESCFRPDPQTTAFLLGKQDVGITLMARLTEVDSNNWTKLTERSKENA